MDYFNYHEGRLRGESVDLTQLAKTYGTPAYVYSRATIERHWKAFDEALLDCPHLVCYAVKANSNLAVLNVMARLGSGFDIVSVGELERVIAAGGDVSKVVFSGVAKQAAEMRRALAVGIKCFNVESEAELERLNTVAGEMSLKAPVSIRVNPDVDAQTHPYISTGLKDNKFGIAIELAVDVYRRAQAMEHLNITGVDCHIGSQLTSVTPFVDALDRVLLLIDELAGIGIDIKHLDVGGGLGIRYHTEQPPEPAEYVMALAERIQGRELEILMEPGRAIAGNAGILLTQVEYLKCMEHKNFAIVDAGMNDLLRPSLYGAWQDIVPLNQASDAKLCAYDVVGPVCETGDFLGKDRVLALMPGDYLAVRGSGAYGFTMASNYNSRPKPVELMVDGDNVHVIRQRETLEDLYASEALLP